MPDSGFPFPPMCHLKQFGHLQVMTLYMVCWFASSSLAASMDSLSVSYAFFFIQTILPSVSSRPNLTQGFFFRKLFHITLGFRQEVQNTRLCAKTHYQQVMAPISLIYLNSLQQGKSYLQNDSTNENFWGLAGVKNPKSFFFFDYLA